MTTIKILELKSEIGAGTHGAGMGIDAIKTAALNKGSLFFGNNEKEEIPNENELLHHPIKYAHARFIEGLTKVYDNMSKAVAQTLIQQQYPIILSGDHASAGATIAGIKMAFPKARLGVIWIDAHADLHTPYTTPSGNMHGTPLAASMNEDNLSQQKNELNPETIRYWKQLKNTGNIIPKILPNDLVIIGLRDYEKEEQALIKKQGIHTIPVPEVRKNGSISTAKKTLQLLDACDMIYLSFDVDSLDPSLSRGTGTPVANGLWEEEAAQLIYSLLAGKKVCSFEITEVNPTLDTKNKMAEIAFGILEQSAKIIKGI